MVRVVAALLITLGVFGQRPAQKALIEDYIKTNVTAVPASLGFDPFYKKYTVTGKSRSPVIRASPQAKSEDTRPAPASPR